MRVIHARLGQNCLQLLHCFINASVLGGAVFVQNGIFNKIYKQRVGV